MNEKTKRLKIKKRLEEILDEQTSFVLPEKVERFNELGAEYYFLMIYLSSIISKEQNMIDEFETKECIQKILL